VLEQAALTDLTTACKAAAGVSRTSYYRWVAKAEKYGLSALMSKGPRAPVMPNAMSAEEVSTVLAPSRQMCVCN
jgi:transposase